MRRARTSVSGLPHHVTQRGNRRMDVFIDAEDRHVYLELLREYSIHHGLRIWDYTLMTNHTHLIVVPEDAHSLSNAMRDTHATYAMIFNRKYGFSGHLWQARFYSCILDEAHLWHAVRYVEQNPVRAGIVARAEDYPWSGAAPHVRGEADRYMDDGLPLIGVVTNWSAWLGESEDDDVIRSIRIATTTGRACGSDEFIRKLEMESGRLLQPQKQGRKPKQLAGPNVDSPKLELDS